MWTEYVEWYREKMEYSLRANVICNCDCPANKTCKPKHWCNATAYGIISYLWTKKWLSFITIYYVLLFLFIINFYFFASTKCEWFHWGVHRQQNKFIKTRISIFLRWSWTNLHARFRKLHAYDFKSESNPANLRVKVDLCYARRSFFAFGFIAWLYLEELS